MITDTEVMGNENNLYFNFGGSQAVARVSKIRDQPDRRQSQLRVHAVKNAFLDKETGVNYTEM